MPRMTATTPIQQVDGSHLWFFVYRDIKSEYRWTLFAGNRKKIATCGEGYKRLIDCEHAINLVADTDGRPIKYATYIRSR